MLVRRSRCCHQWSSRAKLMIHIVIRNLISRRSRMAQAQYRKYPTQTLTQSQNWALHPRFKQKWTSKKCIQFRWSLLTSAYQKTLEESPKSLCFRSPENILSSSIQSVHHLKTSLAGKKDLLVTWGSSQTNRVWTHQARTTSTRLK